MSSVCQIQGAFPLFSRLHQWRLRHANVEFALLAMIATGIAFHTAISLNLKAPSTAAVTVWVVVNTRPGHVLSKSVYRVLGTICGALASIAIVVSLNSVPWFLFTALALWVAVCTGLGNLLRQFRTYFGLLAGYTAAFIVLGAYQRPDHVLDVALDRTSAIVIGVLSMSLVVSLLGVRRSAAEMEDSLRAIHRRCLEAIRDRWEMSAEALVSSRLALVRSHINTAALLEYADLEDPGFRHHTRELRALTGCLLEVLDASRLAARQLDRAEASAAWRQEVRTIFLEMAEALESTVERPDEEGLAETRARLMQLRQLVATAATLAETPAEKELLHPLLHLLDRWLPLLTPEKLAGLPLRDPLQVDVRGGLWHVLRTFSGLMAGVIFWHATGWQEGPGFLINGAAFCALASTSAHPAKTLLMFSKATAVAAAAGFLCKFFLMPHAVDFWSLMLCLAAVLVPTGCLAFSKRPQLDIIGMTSGLFMLAMMQPSNHMTYDPAQYVSSALAAVFGAFFLSVVFSLILPTRPEREAASTLRDFRRSMRGLVDLPWLPSLHAWRMNAHRRLVTLQAKGGTPADLDEGLRVLDEGGCLLRLRLLSGGLEGALRTAVHQVIIAARRGVRSIATADATGRALVELTANPPAGETSRHTLAAHLSELRSLVAPSQDPNPSAP